MTEIKSRKQVFIDFYTPKDYTDTLQKLPGIIEQAEIKDLESLEPTIEERRAVRDFIKGFIREKNRKVYGGTAVNELLKAKDLNDAIYNTFTFKDIEFYSFTPVADLIDLCNALHKNGFKYVQGKEAQHEGTYNIHVNFQLYCDITYVPTNVYYGIKTIQIDGIHYTDPHFIWIDQLRIYTAPMTAYCLWEKTFKRNYLLLKDYPVEYFDKPIQIDKPSNLVAELFLKIKKDFLAENVKEYTFLAGFDAFNFYVRQAMGITQPSDKLARVTHKPPGGPSSLETNVPFVEFFSVNYQDSVLALHSFLKAQVPDPTLLTFEENYPLFQFLGYSVLFKYDQQPLVRVYDADGVCIPIVKLKNGSKYVSYQYTLMTFLMHKFKCFLDKDQPMYLNYGSAISTLINVRNIFLDKNDLPIVNDTIFSEFRITCSGSTVNIIRARRLKQKERASMRKTIEFRYNPETFLGSPEEEQSKNLKKMLKYRFPNASGNIIRLGKNIRFKLNEKGELVVASSRERASEMSESNSEESKFSDTETTDRELGREVATQSTEAGSD
jgi:hypothetical protein